MSLFVFWASLALVAYTYLLYPLLLLARARLRPRPVAAADHAPTASLLICAHDEAASIGAKLDNALALDYPAERLEIIVASDGSSDGTEAIVRAREGERIRLLALPRRGKIAALNAAAAAAAGEILVFSDANSMYGTGALRALLRPLADPRVGGVAGDQRYLAADGAGPDGGDGERSYWSYDRSLKRWQSAAGSVTSATGAIYAIRRSLFERVPPAVTDDFAVSTGVIARGFRLVFAEDAVAFEPVAGSADREFARKVRVMTRGLRGVFVRRELLDPFRHGFYALQLLSHKVLRRLVALPLLALALCSALLADSGPLYRAALLGQAAVYGAALLGFLGQRGLGRRKPFAIPFYFCMVNAASLVAAWNVLRGHRIDLWQPSGSRS